MSDEATSGPTAAGTPAAAPLAAVNVVGIECPHSNNTLLLHLRRGEHTGEKHPHNRTWQPD
ncbi:hypothetical protein CRUP_011513 [Coryphaenoides rupestris]|nr:hypothetical protein CRUP_011513 [Coryphaenoides rupestris]